MNAKYIESLEGGMIEVKSLDGDIGATSGSMNATEVETLECDIGATSS